MLKERVAPRKKRKEDGSKYATKGSRSLLNKDESAISELLIRPSAISFARIVPPLKHFPEEIESDHESDNETFGSNPLVDKDIKDLQDIVEKAKPGQIKFSIIRNRMNDFFKLLSDVSAKKLMKIS